MSTIPRRCAPRVSATTPSVAPENRRRRGPRNRLEDHAMTVFNHRFHPTVLREYDIRGIIGGTLKPEDAFAIGRCFGSVIVRNGGAKVAVGFDGRLSSPDLEPQLVAGLRACGLEVLRVGLVATPMLYYAAYALEADGAAMVTGSHNPPDYNGFKMMLGKKPFFGGQIQEVGRMAAEGDVVPVSTEGSDRQVDIAADYVARVLEDYDGGSDRKLRVVWDPGNGSGCDVTKLLAAKLPGEHFVINGVVDGTFPNHHPDPTVPKNLEQLVEEVAKQKADLGIAFDGDADRLGVVDDEGHVLFGDQMMVVLARDVLRAKPGAEPLMWKTGHSLIKAKMAEIGSPLAGEMSGHIFFADKWYGFDDAPYSAVRLLGIVARMSEPLSAVRAALPQVVNTPELRFDCAEDRKFAVVREVKERLAAEGATVQDVDGVRVLTEDGWWLLRASNTQAVLVARAEAKSEAGLERLKAQLSAQLQASGLAAPDFSGENAGH